MQLRTIRRAIVDGCFPDDVAQTVRENLRIFVLEPALYDKPGLRGAAKHAELVVKLGYWLAKGQLSEKEFRLWADCIPPEDNAGWNVALLRAARGSPFRHVLKMGPLATHPESCLMQSPS